MCNSPLNFWAAKCGRYIGSSLPLHLFPCGRTPQQFFQWLFPPRFPHEHSSQVSATMCGELFEHFTEAWLNAQFPEASIIPKAMLHVVKGISFECDMLMLMPPRVPLKPDFYIVECKNYKNSLPYYFLVDLWWRVHLAGACGGLLFITTSLSRRSQEIADLLGIMVLQYSSCNNTFNPLSHEAPLSVFSEHPAAAVGVRRVLPPRICAG